ncbi:glycosyltransferase involved in cell wall biosynthesis [Gelidibacter sediminis]|uniref:Glycosyltransferase involved in cell wall biosynthesis n=1 Tax=Gelidibacter sediminis TaxID=1608710 RepID=A0A4R7Q5Q9_9FLAO|nr:glycosyltransferase family 4 protein [Gelidibacter sediminis]TDU42885.1 glycosyltransferase involved in cell wall biosynthesis [Gelidibacter sediminis]
MIKILWLAPNFNHYKARFLNHLALEQEIELTIMSGAGRNKMGDQELNEDWSFKHIKLNVLKKDFGKSKIVKEVIKPIFKEFDWILLPAEKKNLPLFLFCIKLRRAHKGVRLFSYNHAQLKSDNLIYSFIDVHLTKFFYKNLDRVIFYTEDSCKKAINNNLILSQKAFWANNTVDNTEIEKYYSFQIPPKEPQTILFIGRLITSKRISDLIEYYKCLKQDHQNLKLEIIGDGPDRHIVETARRENLDIKWHGTLVDESDIAPIMERVSLVFIPGLSGLSINHAFAYGKPYITLKADKHGPEISYLIDGENGYILNGNKEENIKRIFNLLENRALLVEFSKNAKTKSEYLSVQNWVEQIKSSLLHE